MIGVSANPADLEIAEEFFELFKTPWEPAVSTRKYRVVLSTNGSVGNADGELFLVYSSGAEAADREAAIAVKQATGPVEIEWGASTIPIYGRVALFDAGIGICALKSSGKALDYRRRSGARVVRRIGYDLFREIRHLLTEGQPASRASTPTLELHIALLRHLLLESGVPFVEVPPRPDGYDFVCCLTHDVDFFGIRRHRFDRTLVGFVARASVGTLTDLFQGRRSAAEVAHNWLALLSLPFVLLRLAPDFWRPFADYSGVEDGRRSTFFIVPFKGRPGVAPDGTFDIARAVPYEASEIREELSQTVALGSELAVHGIDAWRDADAGRAELKRLTSLTGQKSAGVRMHWLFFASDSPRKLEGAGFDYDSSWGYNDAVGYRAGTSQAFRLPGSDRLMELPLSIMDSALFYPNRMGLTQQEALQLCRPIVANARRFGGTLVINWHGRSLAPERLWGRSYLKLLEEVGQGGRAWVTTAREAVDWFRWRRSIRFNVKTSGRVTVIARARRPALPAARVCIHGPGGDCDSSIQERSFAGDRALTLEL